MSIPKILHFTWKNQELPRLGRRILAKWKSTHPDWDIRFYDDAGIRAVVADHYPEHLALFDSYPGGIFRADAFRFFVLHKFGGIYSDLDVDPLRRIDELTDRTDCFVGAEPELHVARNEACYRGMPFVLCNAFMGSIAQHPFWQVCIERLAVCNAPDVIDATGPRFMNAVALNTPPEIRPDVLLPNYWSPITGTGARWPTPERYADAIAEHFTVVGRNEPALVSHLWRNSWFKTIAYNGPEFWRLPNRLHWALRKLANPVLSRTHIPTPSVTYQDQLQLRPKDRHRVCVHVDLTDMIKPEQLGLALSQLRFDEGSLVFSATGGSDAALEAFSRPLNDAGFALEFLPVEGARSERQNAGLDYAASTADFCLLVGNRFRLCPQDCIDNLISANRPVVTAFISDTNGQDENGHSFLVAGDQFKYLYRNTGANGRIEGKHGKNRYPFYFANHHRVAPLTCVGDDFLLVDCAVVRAGTRFPETAYKAHTGSMGFAIAARDLGFEVCGMPAVKVVVEAVEA